LIVVPADVRDQVSLAYLFARVADMITDTELIDRPRRLDFLGQLEVQFVSDQIDWTSCEGSRERLAQSSGTLPSVSCLNDWKIA
jgi:phytoene/squalene synthetase